MNNIFILTPTFNDSRSLNKLLFVLNKSIRKKNTKFRVIIVNDCSSEKIDLKTKSLHNIDNIKILNLKKNVGSQKAIYIGLKYIEKYKYKSIISVLDSDGEDDPFKLKKLIDLAIKEKGIIFAASRSRRRENILLRTLNKIRLLITFILTGKNMNFGNFSAFASVNLKNIFLNTNLWLAYSGGILKNCKKIKLISIEKKKRYYGISKVNLKFLLDHSIKIICIFRKEIFIRSIFIISLMIFIIKDQYFGVQLIIFFSLLNIFINIYNRVNKLNFNPLKLIGSVSILKKNRQLQTIINF
jgi:polyisoprenyl-phosphate glycosyltransferase